MDLALQLAQLAVVGWLPGALLFHAPVLDRERRAGLAIEERLFWHVILSTAITLTLVISLAAVGGYTFGRLLAIELGISAAAIGLWRGRLRLGPPTPGLTTSVAVPLALTILCAWRFFHPAAYIIGGKDPGTYVNEGVQLAQRGGLLIEDPVVAAVPIPMRDLFFPRHAHPDGTPRSDYYGIRFMGFPISDPDAGTVVGQFPHLLPASMAVGYGVNGLNGVRYATPVWALFGVLSVYFAGARLFGRTAAAAAAALLAVNVIQVWFARYPNTEVVMQALLFAGLLANARAHTDGDRFFAPVSAALLGLLLFLRIDAVLAVGGVGLALTIGGLVKQGPRRSFLVVFSATLVLAVAYYAGPMRAYAHRPIDFAVNLPLWHWAVLIVGSAGAAVLTWSALRRPRLQAVMVRILPMAIAAAVCGAALYALYLRHPGGRLAPADAYALRTFAGFYVSVPAVLAALLGYALFARGSFWRDPALFIVVAVFGFFMFYKLRIVPEHFWAARRYLPVLLPALTLFASAAAVGGSGAGWRARVIRPLLGGTFLLLLGMHFARVSRPLQAHVEYEGLIPRVEKLAQRFGDHDLVVVESRDAGSDTHVFALPLAYIYARNVLVLNSARPDKARFASFIEWARTRYQQVFFIGGGGTDLLSYNYGMTARSSDRFQVPEYQSALNAFPRYVRQKEFEFGLYEFTDPRERTDGWFDLDVGTNDDLHVLRFRAKEMSEGRSFRWTQGVSAVSVTTFSRSAREVTVTMSDGGRPPAAPPAIVEVFLHDQLLGRVDVAGGFRPYALAIPRALAERAARSSEPIEFRLRSTLWNPARVLGSQDDRDLGVMLDRVTIK
ncbi:MAG: glycosyltransferase family 39 protein [Acidobacteria bacterium]|nr:glycosyltransferase family 39 protein [Acidobacteriota bacterium]